ncbi:MAG TPA: hypothetical protein VEN81_01015 [Planctomycetota bacterium]|nr:hypothetical protein [Planctomycetota bacterium]
MKLLNVACVLALFGIGVSLVHFLWPTPLLFAAFMILGQGAFGLAMALYLAIIVRDLRSKKVL